MKRSLLHRETTSWNFPPLSVQSQSSHMFSLLCNQECLPLQYDQRGVKLGQRLFILQLPLSENGNQTPLWAIALNSKASQFREESIYHLREVRKLKKYFTLYKNSSSQMNSEHTPAIQTHRATIHQTYWLLKNYNQADMV